MIAVAGYEVIDSNPEFGFTKNQLVAMKVYKVDNNKTVDILPTSYTYQENFEKSNSDLLVDTVREVRLSCTCIFHAEDVRG